MTRTKCLARALVATLAAALLLALSVPGARADEPRAPAAPVRADAQQDARTLFERGVEASRAERWQEARILFERSLALVVKSSTLLNLAISFIKLGRGAEALEQLDAFQRVATQEEHGAMLERAQVLRAQAEALIANERTARQGEKQALSEERARHEEGLSDAARREVARAREYFARGNDRKALEAFERAYKDSPRAELLYNIGVVADRLRDDERAVQAYEAFAKALPDAPETGVAQVRVTALRKALEERKAREQAEAKARAREAAQAAAREAAAQAPPPAPGPNLWPPRAVMIAGGVLGAGAAGLLGKYFERKKKYTRCEDAPLEPTNGFCNEREKTLDKIGKERDAVMIAAIAAGGAAVATVAAGAIWLVLRKKPSDATEQALWLTPELGTDARATYGLTLSGRF